MIHAVLKNKESGHYLHQDLGTTEDLQQAAVALIEFEAGQAKITKLMSQDNDVAKLRLLDRHGWELVAVNFNLI